MSRRPSRARLLELAAEGVSTAIGVGIWPPDNDAAQDELAELEREQVWIEKERARLWLRDHPAPKGWGYPGEHE